LQAEGGFNDIPLRIMFENELLECTASGVIANPAFVELAATSLQHGCGRLKHVKLRNVLCQRRSSARPSPTPMSNNRND